MADRLQSSIRIILAATAAVGAVLAAAVAKPSFQAAFAINGLTMGLATGAIVAVIETKGRLQAFWAGTAVVLVYALVIAGWSSHLFYIHIATGLAYPVNFYGDSHFLWCFWCVAPINGLFAMVLDWLFTAPNAAEVARDN